MNARNIAAAIGSAAILLGLAATPAAATPSLGLQLHRTTTPVTHGDERLVYEVKVTNTASEHPDPGDELTCNRAPDGEEWFGGQPISFTYRWIRDGVEIPGATEEIYTVVAEDAGSGIQCEVIGTTHTAENETTGEHNVTASAAYVSQPPAVVNPVPAVGAPTVANGQALFGGVRPVVNGVDGVTRTCELPTGWLPSPGISYTYQWLRNGTPIVGATSPEYIPVEAEDRTTVFQCEVTGKTGSGIPPDGGLTVGISNTTAWNLLETPNNRNSSTNPITEFSNSTTGAVTVDFELPGGQETHVFKVSGEGWTCIKQPPFELQHASATCVRNDSLAPEQAYPPIELLERPGRDAPDTLLTKASVSGGGAAAPASAEDAFGVGPAIPFGFESFETKVADELGNDYTQAGGHPFSVQATLAVTQHARAEKSGGQQAEPDSGFTAPNGAIRVVRTNTPRGFVGNPQALPETCPTIADVVTQPTTSCPPGSVAGGITLETSFGKFIGVPIYSIEPEFGTPAEFGFGLSQLGATYSLTPELRPEDGYAITLLTAPIQKDPEFLAASVTLCGFGGVLGINAEDGESQFHGCKKAGEGGANPKPLLTNPTRCSGPAPTTAILADTWEEPKVFKEARFTSPALTGCEMVPFEAEISLQPTSHEADSPTGMDVEIAMPTEGLETPGGIAQANLDNSSVTLPEGMSVNPSLASGLGACSPAEVGLGNNNEATCPDSSKVGNVEVETPLLKEPLKGSVYVAQQGKNPFNSLLALYLVFESKKAGITIKAAGKVTPDPTTGQLTASFAETPEAPFSRLDLHFASGRRAPLINPPACGNYGIEASLSPWSAVDPAHPTAQETVSSTSIFQVNTGPNGGPCPRGELNPKLKAGVANPVAGATTPFVLDLSREDGSSRFSAVDVSMPQGLTGYLRGIPYCPDATLSGISTAEGSGAAELDSPSCPAASQIGVVSVGAGAGPDPLYVNTGRAYLAGPYKGAPLSIAIVTPALAGPFDLGNVVVRSALQINPETAQITVQSDPIPTILDGLLLDVRDIRVDVNRPNFILAPTNCEPMTIGATVHEPGGKIANVSSPFQVGGCENLAFKPKLQLQLKGATKRVGHPALKAVVTYPKGTGYANLAGAQVNLPRGEFLDQGNLNKTCTKPVLLAGNCPASTVYGRAKAWTPLLEKPLEGNVYLVGGYGFKLPALVAELNGQIRVLLVGKVDSGPNNGIRSTFEGVPDAPIEKFELSMKGGKKYGLLENSENLCKAKKANRRAIVQFTAQNGKAEKFKPVVANQCGKAMKKQQGKHGSHARHNSQH